MFEYYKNRLISECVTGQQKIRFCCVQYLCQFPDIDPAEMAANLQGDGFTILFDGSNEKANAANRAAVNKAARRAAQ